MQEESENKKTVISDKESNKLSTNKEVEKTVSVDSVKKSKKEESIEKKEQKKSTGRKRRKRSTSSRRKDPWIGSLIKRRYKVLEKIGEGGMGIVYLARDGKTGKTVAIKFLSPTLANDPSYIKKFKKELEIGKNLDHSNIAKIIASGKSKKIPYIIMEHVQGISLKKFILQYKDKEEFIPIDTVVKIIEQIAKALSYAHKNGVVAHRDIKPENIMIDLDTFDIKVMDFGIAKITDADISKSATSDIFTVEYAAPEQLVPNLFNTSVLDGRVDIYSLGLVFYELITNTLPFNTKGTTIEVIEKKISQIKERKFTPPSYLRKDIPKYIDSIVLKCIQVDREKRYQTMDELLDDLENRRSPNVESNSSAPTELKKHSENLSSGASFSNETKVPIEDYSYSSEKNVINNKSRTPEKENSIGNRGIVSFVTRVSILVFIESWIYYLLFVLLFKPAFGSKNMLDYLHMNLFNILISPKHFDFPLSAKWGYCASVIAAYVSFFVLPEVLLLPTVLIAVTHKKKNSKIFIKPSFGFSFLLSDAISIFLVMINRIVLLQKFARFDYGNSYFRFFVKPSIVGLVYTFFLLKYWIITLAIIFPILSFLFNLKPFVSRKLRIVEVVSWSIIISSIMFLLYPNTVFYRNTVVIKAIPHLFDITMKLLNFHKIIKFARIAGHMIPFDFVSLILSLIEGTIIFAVIPLVVINTFLSIFVKGYKNHDKIRFSFKVSLFMGIIWGTILGLSESSNFSGNQFYLIVFYIVYIFLISLVGTYIFKIFMDLKNNPSVLYKKAISLSNSGKNREALRYLEKALKVDPNNYEMMNLKTTIRDALGDVDNNLKDNKGG